MIKKILSVALAAAVLLSFAVSASAGEAGKLKFSADGDFTILHISDMQDDRYPAYDMLNFVRLAIENTDPDLIVITGDIVEDWRLGDFGVDAQNGKEGVKVEDIHGDLVYDETLDNVKVAVDNIFSIIEEAGIPYAVTQGNNDYKAGISNEDWLDIYAQYEHCLVRDDSPDESGRIDYNLEIKGSDGKIAFNLWLMDSGRNSVNEEQIAWYKSRSAELAAANGGEPVPAMAFQHINTSDIGNLFEKCHIYDEGAIIKDGECYRLNQNVAHGYNIGAVKPGETSDEFSAWKEQGDVIAAFFGHWHNEGYSGMVDGIELGFTYGCQFAKYGPYGYRVITLHEDDIKNYGNELYVYNGSVKRGDVSITKQEDAPYSVIGTPAAKVYMTIVNLLKNLVYQIQSI